MTGRRVFIIATAAALAAIAVSAEAQTVQSTVFTVYPQGSQVIAQQNTLQLAQFNCGQPKITPPPGVIVNPTKLLVDDPADPTKQCQFDGTAPPTGPLFSLPFGGTVYESTLRFVNTAGTSPESARSNLFTKPGAAPAAPSGHRIARVLFGGSRALGFVAGRRFHRVTDPIGTIRLAGDKRRAA